MLLPRVLATLLLMFSCAAATGQQQKDRPRDYADRSLAQPYPLPDWRPGGDPIEVHKDDGATVVFLIADGLWTHEFDTLEAWESPAVQAWIKDTGRVFRADARARGTDWSIPESVAVIIGHSPPEGVYAFRNGQLIDHDRQFTDPEQLLVWLKSVDAGEISVEFARRRAGERHSQSPLEPRLVLAQRLERRGMLEEAADEYTWVLEQAYTQLANQPPLDLRNPQQGPPARQINLWALSLYDFSNKAQDLGLRFPATKARLEALRDRLCDLASDPDQRAAASFALAMVSLVPDPDRTNALLDALEKIPEHKLLLAREVPSLIDSLASQGRWAEAGKIIRRPEESVALHMSKLGIMEAMSDSPRPLDEASPQFYRQTEVESALAASMIYAALLAAGRADEAERAATTAFEVRDSPTIRAIFVTVCLTARQIRPEHRAWAEQGMKSWLFEPRDGEPQRPESLVDLVDKALQGNDPTELSPAP